MGLRQNSGPEELPSRITVGECALALDGGTVCLIGSDQADRDVYILLATPLQRCSSSHVAGRLYFNHKLVPMRSQQEAQILRLLSEATVQVTHLPPTSSGPRMLVLGRDIQEFLQRTPEDNCRAFIRKIVEAVQSEDYLRYATDEEKAEKKAIADESTRDDWERPSGKKKRRPWRGGE